MESIITSPEGANVIVSILEDVRACVLAGPYRTRGEERRGP
jgi:hypothetical protein